MAKNTEGATKGPDTVETSVDVVYDQAENADATAVDAVDTEGSKNLDEADVTAVDVFFAENPTAKSVLKVGDSLFLAYAIGAANDFAKRNNLTVQMVKNPNL